MFPDSYDRPSQFGKDLIGFFIAVSVFINFFHPKSRSCFGFSKTDRTFMPEATIDKNGNVFSNKHNIGFSGQVIVYSVSSNPS